MGITSNTYATLYSYSLLIKAEEGDLRGHVTMAQLNCMVVQLNTENQICTIVECARGLGSLCLRGDPAPLVSSLGAIV